MRTYLVTYKTREDKVDGMMFVLGRSWEDVNSAIRQKYGNKLIIDGVSKGDILKSNVNSQIVFQFESGEYLGN